MRARRTDAILDLTEQPEKIPVQGVAQSHGIWEAMRLFQRQRRAVEGADHCAAALGAQVKGEESEGSHQSVALSHRVREGSSAHAVRCAAGGLGHRAMARQTTRRNRGSHLT